MVMATCACLPCFDSDVFDRSAIVAICCLCTRSVPLLLGTLLSLLLVQQGIVLRVILLTVVQLQLLCRLPLRRFVSPYFT